MSNVLFSGVEDTLFIPLMARKYVSEAFPQYFYDAKALELAHKAQPNAILEKSTEYTSIASASRCVVMDDITRKFIEKQNASNIVCIGCGLETMAWRLSEYQNKVLFYDIDFESVIQQRQQLLGCLANETLIAGNANTLDLTQYVDCTLPTLFVVAGVFEYFKETDVLRLIQKLQKEFPHAELLFDTTSRTGLKIANRYVQKTGNTDAMMYFWLEDGTQFAQRSHTTLIQQCSMYALVTKSLKRHLKLYTRISIYVSDLFRMSNIFYFAL